jgi:hypothetical protein
MTTFKKILGAAVTALLVSAPVAATAAQTVRPMTSLVSAQGKGIQSGLRTGVAKKGQSAADGTGTALAVGGVILFGGGLYLLLKDDDDDDLVSPD